MGTTTRLATSLRIHPDDLERIDQLAAQHGLSRSRYMVNAALGELTTKADLEQRLDDATSRLERLEQIAYATS